MVAAWAYMVEEAVEAIFQDSGSEFGGDASDSDFEDSQAENSHIQASLPSDGADCCVFQIQGREYSRPDQDGSKNSFNHKTD